MTVTQKYKNCLPTTFGHILLLCHSSVKIKLLNHYQDCITNIPFQSNK